MKSVTPKQQRKLNTKQRAVLNAFFKYLKGKRYSKSTVNTYTYLVADFVEYNSQRSFADLNNRNVELFLESVIAKRQFSISTQRQFISALKFFI
nr:site-specific integrase [uncultured Psychroserpens sp.]